MPPKMIPKCLQKCCGKADMDCVLNVGIKNFTFTAISIGNPPSHSLSWED